CDAADKHSGYQHGARDPRGGPGGQLARTLAQDAPYGPGLEWRQGHEVEDSGGDCDLEGVVEQGGRREARVRAERTQHERPQVESDQGQHEERDGPAHDDEERSYERSLELARVDAERADPGDAEEDRGEQADDVEVGERARRQAAVVRRSPVARPPSQQGGSEPVDREAYQRRPKPEEDLVERDVGKA